jgi:hypothetical protein
MLNTREILNYHDTKYEHICLLAYDVVYPRIYIPKFLCVCAAFCTSALIMNMADSSETWVSIYQAKQWQIPYLSMTCRPY